MPSVGSTPTTTSPAASASSVQQQLQQQQQQFQKAAAKTTTTSNKSNQHQKHHQPQQKQQQQHPKLQQQHSLPLQLQYNHYQPQVTTTQPSPAGTFISQSVGIITTTTATINGADIGSPLSSSNSFSSVDTNQTLLNTIMQQQQQSMQRTASNRSYCTTKYSQFMIITPAVSIDRDFEYETSGGGSLTAPLTENDADEGAYFNNGNIFRMSLMQSSIDSGNSSESSFRSNYNPYLHTSRQHLLPKGAPHFYTFSSWRWCTLICAAMRCFGAGQNSNAAYSTTFGRPPYHRSRSSGGGGYNSTSSALPHRRLRSSSSFCAETAFEHFSAPFAPRKTRDHMNNITYEL